MVMENEKEFQKKQFTRIKGALPRDFAVLGSKVFKYWIKNLVLFQLEIALRAPEGKW